MHMQRDSVLGCLATSWENMGWDLSTWIWFSWRCVSLRMGLGFFPWKWNIPSDGFLIRSFWNVIFVSVFLFSFKKKTKHFNTTTTEVNVVAHSAACCPGVGMLLTLELHTVGIIPFSLSRGQLSKWMFLLHAQVGIGMRLLGDFAVEVGFFSIWSRQRHLYCHLPPPSECSYAILSDKKPCGLCEL